MKMGQINSVINLPLLVFIFRPLHIRSSSNGRAVGSWSKGNVCLQNCYDKDIRHYCVQYLVLLLLRFSR